MRPPGTGAGRNDLEESSARVPIPLAAARGQAGAHPPAARRADHRGDRPGLPDITAGHRPADSPRQADPGQTRPASLILNAVIHHVLDEEDPCGIVGRYKQGIAPGSYLLLTHFSSSSPEARALEAVLLRTTVGGVGRKPAG
ncbi:MAG TPA: hypothetical protein DHU96_20485 [Actinobacteria bacterium]|nr:hypothetical protein [Actinomycetota bacterium]